MQKRFLPYRSCLFFLAAMICTEPTNQTLNYSPQLALCCFCRSIIHEISINCIGIELGRLEGILCPRQAKKRKASKHRTFLIRENCWNGRVCSVLPVRIYSTVHQIIAPLLIGSIGFQVPSHQADIKSSRSNKRSDSRWCPFIRCTRRTALWV